MTDEKNSPGTPATPAGIPTAPDGFSARGASNSASAAPGAPSSPYNTAPAPCAAAFPEEDEINLLDLFIVLLKHKWMIFWIVFVTGVLAVVVSLLMTPIFRSEATIAPSGQEKGAGGLATALGGFGAMIASESGVMGAGSLEQFSVVLKSRELTNAIVQRYNLMPILFEDAWDARRKRWTVDEPPTLQDAYKRIQEGMLTVSPDKKQNVMKISFDYKDARMARTFLDYYILGLSESLRRQTLEDAQAQQVLLSEQLAKTSDPLLKNRLYELIAKQIEKEALAKVQKYYGFNVIDPAFVPDRKFKPKRAVICVLSVVVAFFIAVFLAFFREYLTNIGSREDPERLAALRRHLRLRKKE